MPRLIDRLLYRVVVGGLALLLAVVPALPQAALMPNAKQTFLDQNGKPLSNGTVKMYVPGTSVAKQTWQDAGETQLNTNPIQLDAAGRAVIYGQGAYQQQVLDASSVQQWNALTNAYNSAPPSGATGTDTAPVGTVMAFSGFVVPTNWQLTYGQALDRVTFADLKTAITITDATISCANTSVTLSGFASTAQIRIGAPIEASCLPTSTTVASIVSANSVTVSNAATATATVTAIVYPWGNGNGTTTFNVPDLRGKSAIGANAMGGTASATLQHSTTIATTSGSNVATVASATGLAGGMIVTSANVPVNTFIVQIIGTTVTLSANATASASGTVATFLPFISANVPASSGGSDTHLQTVAESPTITPLGTVAVTVNNGAQVGNTTSVLSATAGSGASFTYDRSSAVGDLSATATFSGVPQGGGAAMSTYNPALSVNYIIKVKSNSTGSGGVVSIGGMFGDVVCNASFVCAPVAGVNTIGCAIALTTQIGCLKPDGTSIIVNPTTGLASAIAGIASQITVGTTTVTNSTNGYLLFNNAGILGDKQPTGTGLAVLQTSPTILGHPTIESVTSTGATGTGKFVFDTAPTISAPTLTGTVGGVAAIPNAVLVNSATTINGTSCTLGASCSPTAVASSITNGTTTVTGGTTTRVLFDNAGVLGEYQISGGGSICMTTNCVMVTPTLGAATATSINGNTLTAGTWTLTGGAAKTLTFSNTLTFTGTDGTSMAFPTTNATIARTDAAQTFTGVQTFGTPIVVSSGGTGLATLTAHGVMLGEGTSNVAFATIGTAGRLLIDQGAGADPSFNAMSSDATITSGGALTIASGAVTYAKFQNIAASSLHGNPTGSSAVSQAIGLGNALAFISTNLVSQQIINAQTGTTYTVLDTDRAKLVSLKNAASIAVTLPQAGASSLFIANWWADFQATGAGTVTITPTTSTINAGSTLALTAGQSAHCVSDGTNYLCELGAGSGAGSGTVTSATIAAGTGIGVSGTCVITTSGTCTVATALSTVTNSLSGDVALNNTGLYFDGPSVAQGTSGTWCATGTVTLIDTTAASNFIGKLWDGTTVIASGKTNNFAASGVTTLSLSGCLASPAANIKISVNNPTDTSGSIKFNLSGASKDSTLTAIRVQ